ncbi:YeeE/YedE thiosulfate transporter family protein [Propionivibrio limicola]|uniref:YeeE/YedE thiosulfate transporter family protein n=1 Tax=Propionivibrio limicola TaxID=167645 RepID=UPI001290A1AD|nr:YeeE/YedE thiosulfate transporter family protein [Propionivibrio limicola]
MSVLNAIIIGLLMGIVFGFALEKSRVFEPGMIVGQMQLRNFTMLKVFLTAVITGLVVIGLMHGFFGGKLHPKALLYGANIFGGLMLGAGITLAGGCPGTVLAQIGAGYKDSWLVLLGGLAGALTFSYLEPTLKPILLSGGPGKLTLDTVTDVPFWVLAFGFAIVLVIVLVALERWRPWQADLGANYDGMNE